MDGSECFRLHGSSDDGGGGFIRILEEIDVLQGLRGLLSGVGVDEGGSIDLIEPCQALALTLHSPLVLHNFLCQPLSYRIATRFVNFKISLLVKELKINIISLRTSS